MRRLVADIVAYRDVAGRNEPLAKRPRGAHCDPASPFFDHGYYVAPFRKKDVSHHQNAWARQEEEIRRRVGYLEFTVFKSWTPCTVRHQENGLTLDTVWPFHVAAYIEQMPGSKLISMASSLRPNPQLMAQSGLKCWFSILSRSTLQGANFTSVRMLTKSR